MIYVYPEENEQILHYLYKPEPPPKKEEVRNDALVLLRHSAENFLTKPWSHIQNQTTFLTRGRVFYNVFCVVSTKVY